MEQTTVARSVEWRGIGLHSGRPASVTVHPADPGTGLVFRVDVGDGSAPVLIPARADRVASSERATTLATEGPPGGATSRRTPAAALAGSIGRPTATATAGEGPRVCVATVEHLLAALFAFGIHDAWIDVEGGEIPALDGSAAPFAEGLKRAGRRRLAAARRTIVIDAPLEVGDGDRRIRIEPADALAIDYTIDFDHPAIGRQRHVVHRLDREAFVATLAPARTFGFADEVDRLRGQGLAQGGDLDNTLVLGEVGLLNPGPLRFADEFVRHKIVDLLGDLALLEAELAGRIVVERGGHGLHHALVRAIVERATAEDRCEAATARVARRRVAAQPA